MELSSWPFGQELRNAVISDQEPAMTIEAETLVQLTAALQQRGIVLVSDVRFTRAPYRMNHLWTCTVE